MKLKTSLQFNESFVHSGYYFGQEFPRSQHLSFPYLNELFSCYSDYMETTGETFESAVIAVLAEIIEDRHLKPARLGRSAFKGERARKVVGQLIKGYQFKSASGKKMRLRIADLYDLCAVLGETPAEIMALASHKLKSQQNPATIIPIPEKKEKTNLI